jgi:hypothetical protein
LSSGADDAIRSNGDKVRRTYLGISDSVGVDTDFLQYKGKQLPLSVCTDSTGDDWAYKTRGYHMDVNASALTISSNYTTSGTPLFFVGASSFTSDPQNESNQYYRLFARKFTLLCIGGFDGWDIYREYRTNADRFVLGRSGYLRGACPSIKYPTATGWGAFKQITVGLRGDARPGDILTYNWSPPHVYGNPQKWIGAKMIPSLIEKFNELGYDWNDENSDFNFLICVKKELFDIGSDLSITRSDDNIYTTGSGKNIALGYLAGKSWKTKEEAALLAIEAVNTASKYDIHTGGPVQVEII